MTNSPNQDNQQTPQRLPNPWWRILLISGVGLGGVTLATGFGLTWWVHQQLAPLIETQLTQQINRPVKVGALQFFTPNSIRFGASSLPATSTAPDHASTQAVEANFSLSDLFFNRTLTLDIRLIKPNAYLQEDSQGNWLNIKTKPAQKTGFFTTKINSVAVEDAFVSVIPFPKNKEEKKVTVSLSLNEGIATLTENNERVNLDLKGQFKTGGKFRLQANSFLPKGETKLQVFGQNIDVPELAAFLHLPNIRIQRGRANVNFVIHFKNDRLLGVYGNAAFPYIKFNMPGVQEVIKTEGKLRFNGRKILVDSLNTNLDQIAFNLGGVLEFDTSFNLNKTKVDLRGELLPVATDVLFNTIKKQTDPNFAFPVPLVGELGMKVQVKGTLLSPDITGTIASTKPILLDHLQLSQVSTDFKLTLDKSLISLSNLQIKPSAGGIVTGAGDIKLPFPPLTLASQTQPQPLTATLPTAKPPEKILSGLFINIKADNLPAEAIASFYIPTNVSQILKNNKINIGNVSAQMQILGTFDNIQGNMQWEAKQGTYPLSGSVQLVNNIANLDSITLKIADGTVTVNGQLNQSGWQASINTDKISLSPLLAELQTLKNDRAQFLVTLPPNLSLPNGSLNGKIELLGTYNPTTPNAIAAKASGSLQLTGGDIINLNGELGLGRFQATLESDRVALTNIQPTLLGAKVITKELPQEFNGIVNGRVTLAGNLDNLNINEISAEGISQIFLPSNGGVLNVKGILEKGNWQTDIISDRVDINQIQPGLIAMGILPKTLPKSLTGNLDARLEATGTINNFSPNAIAFGSSAAIVAKASGKLQLPNDAGIINAQGKLENGRWQGIAKSDRVYLNPLQPDLIAMGILPKALPSEFLGIINGEVNATGSLDNFSTNSIIANASGQIQLPDNGIINGSGNLREGKWQASVKTDNSLNISRLQPGLVAMGILPKALPKEFLGVINGEVNATGSLDNFSTNSIIANASGQIQLPDNGIINGSGNLNAGNWQASVKTNNLLDVNRLQPGLVAMGILPQPLKINGQLEGQVNVSGNLSNLNSNAIALQGSLNLIFANGGVVNGKGKLEKNLWNAVITTEQMTVKGLESTLMANGLISQTLPSQLNGNINSQFNLSGSLDNRKTDAIALNGYGQIQLPNQGGMINAIVTSNNSNLRVSLESDRLALSPFSSLLPSLPKGEKTESTPPPIKEKTETTPPLLKGKSEVTPPLLKGGLGGDLRGELNSKIDIRANLNQLTPQGIKASGKLEFSQFPLAGINLTPNSEQGKEETFSTTVEWDGQRISLNTIDSKGIAANGFIAVAFPDKGNPSISNIDLNLKVDNFNLATLSQFANLKPLGEKATETNFPVTGYVGFNGKIQGKLNTLTLGGDVTLRKFAIPQVAFEPLLTGTIKGGINQGLNLQLNGKKDRLEVALNPNFLPQSFLIRHEQTLAMGNIDRERALIKVAKFPLDLLKLAPLPAQGFDRVNGLTSGEITIVGWENIFQQSNPIAALNKIQATGNIAIESPEIGYIKADNFQTQFNYSNGKGIIKNGQLKIGQGLYSFAGTLAPDATPQLQGKMQIKDGSLPEILTALKYFNIEDFGRGLKPPSYGNASDLQTVAVGISNAPLTRQLQRLSEIDVILEKERSKPKTINLPPLKELQGKFNGEITATASFTTGLQAQFNLQGKEWLWGTYKAQELSLEGGFKDGTLTIQPLRILSNNTLIGFAGQIGEKAQSGQLRIKNIPVEELAKLVELPFVDVSGNLNVRANIAGNIENPQVVGELSLLEGILNRQPIKKAEWGFNYNNARLNFGGQAFVTKSEPVDFQGSFPIDLPFTKVKAETENIVINISLKDEGIQLFNILTPNVSWQNGKGSVQLKVEGTLKNPIAEGFATFDNATVKGLAFPEAITGLTGKVEFIGDRVRVNNINGVFSKGKIVANGVIPISQPFATDDRDRANPIKVKLEQLALNLKGIYRGGVTGAIEVGGTVLNPLLGGDIGLYDGQIFLGGGGDIANKPPTTEGNNPFELGFNNLRINLIKDTRVSSPPVINFIAKGNLTINGTLDNIQPQGTISLTNGSVNLFTSEFRLAGGYRQTATFLPSQGLDPNLDVRLVTAVPEVLQYRRPSTALAAEIADPITNVGDARTVRIEAIVKGKASQLEDNLVFSSSPSRSKEEIIGLLGGSFINSFGKEGGTLAIANLAGASLFNNLQSAVINATGLGEFRLFPTQTYRTSPAANQDTKSTAATLGLGLEVGVDLTHNFSVSILKILTTNQIPEYNIRYRVNDNILIRGTTNFQDETRSSIQYEIRF
jgi:translocation and assembly module TamB